MKESHAQLSFLLKCGYIHVLVLALIFLYFRFLYTVTRIICTFITLISLLRSTKKKKSKKKKTDIFDSAIMCLSSEDASHPLKSKLRVIWGVCRR